MRNEVFMFYEVEEKKLLGRYFKYQREIQHIKFSDIVSLGICDYKTLKGIEEGKQKPNDEFYDKLANYYQMDVQVLPLLKEIEPYIHELYDACEWYDKNKAAHVIQTITDKVKHVKNKPLIRELVEAIQVVEKEYILNTYLNQQELLHTLELIRLWDNHLASLLVEACGRSNMNFVYSNEIFTLMNPLVNRKDPICKYWYARICISKVNYTEALDIYQELYDYYDETNNSIRKVRILMKMFNTYRDIDYKKAQEYAIKLENILKQETLPETLTCSIYYNFGMYYYLNNNYEKALTNYEKSNEIEPNKSATLFICGCRSRLGIITNYKFKVDPSFVYYPCLHYFEMKANNNSEKELEHYILKDVMNVLVKEKYEQPLWSMFNYEMSELVKKTRNYKNYHIYQEKFQKSTNSAL